MPIEVRLFFPLNSEMITCLTECPSIDHKDIETNKEKVDPYLRNMIEAKTTKYARIELDHLAILQDIYDRTNELSKEDIQFFKQFRHKRVFLPTQFARRGRHSRETMKRFLGTLNLSFLGWIKTLAYENRLSLLLNYLHERGDNPYESAYWKFNYLPLASVTEAFGMSDHDGSLGDFWVQRMQNGNVFYSS